MWIYSERSNISVNKIKTMKQILKIGLTAGALLPLLVFAQGGISPVEPLAGNVNIQTIINTVSNWALGLLIALATLFVIYAAYLYLQSSGDEEDIGKAKNTLIYAVVAIVVGLLAKAVAYIVTQLIR